MLLEVEKVSVIFGGIKALDDVSITIDEGEIRGLIGPNGAGKSTLVSTIAGNNAMSSGRVLFGGRDIGRYGVRRRAALGIGRSFQMPSLAPRLTVGENLDIARRFGLRRTGRNEASRRAVESLLSRLEMGEWLDTVAAMATYPTLKLADTLRALLILPRLLLVDEPAAGLAQDDREKLVALLRWSQLNLNTTLVIVEHDVPLVFGLCDRITVLDSGKLIADGPTEEIRSHPEVIAAYLGAAS